MAAVVKKVAVAIIVATLTKHNGLFFIRRQITQINLSRLNAGVAQMLAKHIDASRAAIGSRSLEVVNRAIGSGLIASLARPGGNVTGTSGLGSNDFPTTRADGMGLRTGCRPGSGNSPLAVQLMAMPRKDPGPRSMVGFIGRVIKGSKPGEHPDSVEPALATLWAKPSIGDVLSEVDQAMVEVPRSSCAPLPAEAATS